MLKTLGFLALFGVLIALTPAPASAAADGARNAQAAVTHDEISARRYYRRYYQPYRYYRPYRYYYRPRYYHRPYRPYRYYRYY